ncbi:LysR family transcriptional regulator [Streptomyces sp. NPDC001212]|uniref:LysR family transcriptional regulator n=1 Tax=Streptomyces sp. HYC2 TaxID=2955207 RepID=UPI0024804CD2|nr:LysR family transcriptional regulator [Streptomyces sp. HYC2]
MSVDAEDVRYFHVLAEAKTLVRASQEIGVDHTTVSRRIGRLEKALGVRLFSRTSTGWRLTPSGEGLLPAARLVSLGTDAFAKGDPIVPVPEEWTILAPDGFAAAVLAPRCGRAITQERAVLRIVTVASLASREGVSYDVAVVRTRPTSPRVRSQELARYEIGLYATRDYLRRHPEISRIEDLHEHVLCWYEEDPLAAVPDFEALRPMLPNVIQLQSNNLLVHEEAALAGVGIAVMPSFIAGRHPSLVRVLPDEVSYAGRYWVVLPAAQLRWEITQKVLQFLRHAVADAGLAPCSRERRRQGSHDEGSHDE